MDLTYSTAQIELKLRARELTRSIMTFEEQCEEKDGLPADALEVIAKSTLAAGLNAINMPARMGRSRAVDSRPGARARGARTAYERPLGRGVAPGQRARGPALPSSASAT